MHGKTLMYTHTHTHAIIKAVDHKANNRMYVLMWPYEFNTQSSCLKPLYNNNENLVIITMGWLVVPHRERTRERAAYKPLIDMAVKFYTYCLFPHPRALQYKCVLYSNPEQAHIHALLA